MKENKALEIYFLLQTSQKEVQNEMVTKYGNDLIPIINNLYTSGEIQEGTNLIALKGFEICYEYNSTSNEVNVISIVRENEAFPTLREMRGSKNGKN